MEFINISTHDVNCDHGAMTKEIFLFSGSSKHYSTSVQKCVGQRLTSKDACIICSIVHIALNSHYLKDNTHSNVAKKLKLEDSNYHKVLLKTPCLEQGNADNTISKVDEEKKSHVDKVVSSKENVDGDGIATLEESNSSKVSIKESNGDKIKTVLDNGKKIGMNVDGGNQSEIITDTDGLEKQVDELETTPNKKRKKKKKQKKKMEEEQETYCENKIEEEQETYCKNLPAVLKAPCLNSVGYGDLLRKNLVNMLSFWFGYIDFPQVKSNLRLVKPTNRKEFSPQYEWVLCKKDKMSIVVVVIPICALSHSKLLLHQSYGLVFSENTKVLSAYIHKDFDIYVPSSSLLPSKDWITDVLLPELKNRAASKNANSTSISVDDVAE